MKVEFEFSREEFIDGLPFILWFLALCNVFVMPFVSDNGWNAGAAIVMVLAALWLPPRETTTDAERSGT